MKRLLIIIALFFSFSTASKASHTFGGEIGWTCLANGKYVFYMTFYKDCTGIPYTYETETLTIYGNPMPKDASGNSFNTITLEPDSNRWIAERNGDTSPTCTNQYGNAYTCDNGDQGTVQQFFWKSAPITLSGTPSRAGWRFFWESACCRPGNIENMETPGPLTLRAEMFRTKDGDDTNPCIDSSPEFRSLPTTLICRGYEFTYNSTAIDSDLDSLIYSWDRPYNGPGEAPVPLVYKPGYSADNPTPDKTFDVKNIPSTLNPLSGVIKMAVYSGVTTEKFMTVIQVDSYRDGVKIASVYREIPVSIFNCPTLPNGKKNNPPEVFIDGEPAEGIIVDVTAGQEVRIPIQIKDLDITGIGTQLQEVTVVPDGLMFSRDRVNPDPCQVTFGAGQNLVVEPCAYLRNKTPFLDVGATPPERKITGLSSVATEFVWQTDCRHIQTKTGAPGSLQGIYNFVLRVQDDHCPVPAINYPTVTVRVKDPFPLKEPIMKGIDVDLNGDITYQWVPAIDSAFTFEKHIVEEGQTFDGIPVPATNWNVLNSNLRDFQQKEQNPLYPIFRNVIPTDPTSPKNILSKIPNRDWYMRMITVSGCTDDVESDRSEQVRIIETNVSPSGDFPAPPRSEATLTWNRPKSSNAATKDYFYYESPTRFYIWENDSISNGEVGVAANWYLRGNTDATTFSVPTNVCSDYVAFRVEARDTVITWKQGNAPSLRLDSLDTLVFSTFSIIDTLFMVTEGAIPRPKLDTIEVRADGSVYFRVNRADAGTAGSFNFYTPTLDPANLVGTIGVKDGDSLLIAAQGANTSITDYIIEAIDICNPTVTRPSFVYQTILPSGELLQPRCSSIYRLRWNAPTGFSTLIKNYQVYTDTTGTGNNFQLANTVDGTVTSADIPVFRDKVTLFKVIATDNEGAVNISATHSYRTPNDLRSFEIVPPPSLRCAFVEDDGSVSVSFIRPLTDSTLNGKGYEFQSRRDGGIWQDFGGSGLVTYDFIRVGGTDNGDTAVRITGINAQTARYDFRARMLSGCSGSEPSAWSNVMSSIFVEATAIPNDEQKKGNVVWNTTGVDYGASAYDIFRDTFNLRYTEELFARDTLTNIVDNQNGDVCFGAQNYYVKILDEQSACISRSNVDSALYQDNDPPPPLKLNYITVIDGNVIAYWSVDNDLDTDSLFFTTTDGFNSGLQAYRSIGETRYKSAFREYTIPFTVLDARDSAVVVGAIAQDGCGNRSSEDDLEFHKTMDVEVNWFVCDSSMNLTWNPYVGFNENFDVVYEVYFDSVGDGSVPPVRIPESIGNTDTTFSHKIEVGDKFYRYYVKASSLDPAANVSFESTSSVDSAYAIYEDEPRFGYLTFATVEDNVVKLEYNKDKLITVKGYNIYRGQDKLLMNQVGYVDFQSVKDDDFFDFTDGNVDVNSFSYFYKVEVLNACDEPVDTSNYGRSILLGVTPDNEAITNTLRWNEYEEWDSTVAYYNVYRGVDAMPTNNVYAVVPPAQGEMNLFVDNVYDDVFSIGKFCYRVDAIQGAVSDDATNGIPNNLSPAVSSSNVVCITQEPLFYVPNAFAPDGVNNTFGPKGQFFDFSLYEMVIFNRWGEEIYRTRDINKGWDGSFNGEDSQLGTYVYTIRFIDADGNEHKRKGTVTLVK